MDRPGIVGCAFGRRVIEVVGPVIGRCVEVARLKAATVARMISTSSCDIAYSESPAASRACKLRSRCGLSSSAPVGQPASVSSPETLHMPAAPALWNRLRPEPVASVKIPLLAPPSTVYCSRQRPGWP